LQGLAPVAAALPTFGIFYAIGLFIFEHLGQAAGGGLLIAIGGLLAVVSGVALVRGQRPIRP
jgi:hypothetical protein